MGYSEDPAMVRVDFFKPSGKWYTTEAVKWTGKWHGSTKDGIATRTDVQMIHGAFAQSLRDHLGQRLNDMDAICLHPYHEHEHPIQLKAGSWNNEKV